LPPKTRFSIWYFLIAFLIFLSAAILFSSKVETISYSQFKQYIAQGNASKLIIGPENIKGTLRGTQARSLPRIRVDDPNLVKELDERKVSYSGRYESKFLSGDSLLGSPHRHFFS
jgi:cell division protease FtsH